MCICVGVCAVRTQFSSQAISGYKCRSFNLVIKITGLFFVLSRCKCCFNGMCGRNIVFSYYLKSNEALNPLFCAFQELHEENIINVVNPLSIKYRCSHTYTFGVRCDHKTQHVQFFLYILFVGFYNITPVKSILLHSRIEVFRDFID